ncbi:MAG: energy transducer TonB, partial [Rhodanobacteraceae bacterium]
PFRGRMPSAMVLVKITIMPDGSVGDASVYQSSGLPAFDDATLDAARRATYAPAIAYCKPTVGAYLFKAKFM